MWGDTLAHQIHGSGKPEQFLPKNIFVALTRMTFPTPETVIVGEISCLRYRWDWWVCGCVGISRCFSRMRRRAGAQWGGFRDGSIASIPGPDTCVRFIQVRFGVSSAVNRTRLMVRPATTSIQAEGGGAYVS